MNRGTERDQYWNYAEKKGYSGTAIFAKNEPLSVSYGIGIEEYDKEGRVITLEYDNFYLVTCYTPNSQNELKRLPYRMQWEDDFREYLKALDGGPRGRSPACSGAAAGWWRPDRHR